jgi:type IX secretion system PorP/SprF family membrane protein
MQIVTYDAGAGLYVYSSEFWFSFSAPQIIGNKLQFFEDFDGTLSTLERHYYLGAGYKFEMVEDFEFEPSFMVKYVEPISPQFDVALRMIYADMVWLGASYKLSAQPQDDNAIGILAGLTLQENLTMGYSFELPVSNTISSVTTGSHEIMLGIRFKDRN